MAKKVSEKMRKELRKRIKELTPKYKWYTIARDERESVQWAYLRVSNEDSTSEIFSDDGVTSWIYNISRGNILMAERTIEWMKKNNLWMGSKFNLDALPKKEEVEACIEDIDQAIDIFETASLSADNKPDLNAAMDKIKESYGDEVFFAACAASGLSKRAETEVDDAEVQACVDEINRETDSFESTGTTPTQSDLAYIKVDYGDAVFFQACRRLDLEFTEE